LTLRQNVGSVSTKFIIRSQPALLTRMPIPPTSFSTRSTAAVTAAWSVMSTAKAAAVPPARRTLSSAPAALRSNTASRQPSSASRSEIARPMPLPPPVTRAT
jgi:hypothetical protein